jgi:hypothetical protein
MTITLQSRETKTTPPDMIRFISSIQTRSVWIAQIEIRQLYAYPTQNVTAVSLYLKRLTIAQF